MLKKIPVKSELTNKREQRWPNRSVGESESEGRWDAPVEPVWGAAGKMKVAFINFRIPLRRRHLQQPSQHQDVLSSLCICRSTTRGF
ncbi:hypothetical protein CDAR_178551 [Caerostris darwini]|uniref:Uncharacterized protein n=1 Tax=Caerostris darwini TaxID=1538125 RepID=A0AAV4PG08_9ARAC|nr:hypothetical protein CDAR_178551 [Caerostris darwini]